MVKAFELLVRMGESPLLRERFEASPENLLAQYGLDDNACAALMSGAAAKVREAAGIAGGAEPPKLIVVPAAAFARAA